MASVNTRRPAALFRSGIGALTAEASVSPVLSCRNQKRDWDDCCVRSRDKENRSIVADCELKTGEPNLPRLRLPPTATRPPSDLNTCAPLSFFLDRSAAD